MFVLPGEVFQVDVASLFGEAHLAIAVHGRDEVAPEPVGELG